MKHARRLLHLPPYPFAAWSERVEAVRKQGKDVIRLDIGSPDLPPPEPVIGALCRSARGSDCHGYPGYRGLPVLREAIAAYYARRFGVTVDPETQVLPLIGCKEGIVNLALACLDRGDVALVPNPGYAPYNRGTVLAGGIAHTFPLAAERGFLPDLESIPDQVADEATLMWLNYPNNPTGATAEWVFFAQAVDYARRHNLLLCHDATYCDVAYDGYQPPSLLGVAGAAGVAVEFNSLSKLANMAGWRIGFAVGNADAVGALAQVKSNVDSGIFQPLQEAAVVALAVDRGWLAERNGVYRERLDVILAGVRAVGMEAVRPRAALYVWARVPAGWASESFAQSLLEKAAVAVAPGTFFGAAGQGYVRISVTAPTARCQEAMERMVEIVRELVPVD